MAISPQVSFRATTEFHRLVNRSDPPAAIATRDLLRYYALLDAALAGASLSEPEWNYLRDILNDSVRDERTADYLWAEVQDAGPEYGEKWGVDAAELARRLREMPRLTRLAIVDSVGRWWDAQPPS